MKSKTRLAGRRTVIQAIGSIAIVTGTVSGISTAKGTGQAQRNPNGAANGASQHSIVVADGERIQDTIDSATAGATIVVEAGIYEEQLLIDKDVHLVGNPGAVIREPEGREAYTVPESGATIEPIVFACGGDIDAGTVSGDKTIDVSITGFAIDGGGTQPDARRKVGVLCRNVRGRGPASIGSNRITDLGVGGRETMGILVYGDSDIAIENNVVRGFERGGIGANGIGDEGPAPHVLIQDNELDSDSSLGGWAPNGIQLGYGATGTVRGNNISNCRWAGAIDDDWAASGVLIFESDDVQVRDNHIVNCDAGIGLETWGWFRRSANNTKVHRNRIEDVLTGVSVGAMSWSGYSVTNPTARNNTIINNEMSTDRTDLGAVGVAVFPEDASHEYDPIVENNKIVRNEIRGFERQLVDAGSGSKIAAIRP